MVAPGSATVAVTSDWGSGLTAAVSVVNAGPNALHNWQVEIDTTAQITNIWNGTIVSHAGQAYVIGDAGYNGVISAAGSASFGFQATHVVAGEGLAALLLKAS